MFKTTSADQYIVSKGGLIDSYSQDSLIKLYQPLVGAVAMAIYFTFMVELEQESLFFGNKNNEYLYQCLNISADQFDSNRYLLEAVGLIKTYIRQEENKTSIIYEVYPPLSPDKFYKHRLFKDLLRNQIGEFNYDATIMHFRKRQHSQDQSFIDKSAQFLDVFGGKNNFNSEKNDLISIEEIISAEAEALKIDYDVELVIRKCGQKIDISAFTPNIKLQIAQIGALYRISIADMEAHLCGCYDRANKKINIKKLSKRIAADIVKNPIVLNEVSGQEAYLKYTPIEFLTFKYFNQAPMPEESKIINDLVIASKLPYPVINVMIDFVLKTYQNRLSKSALDKIAGTMIREKIKDVDSAYQWLFKSKEIKVDNTSDKEKADNILSRIEELIG